MAETPDRPLGLLMNAAASPVGGAGSLKCNRLNNSRKSFGVQPGTPPQRNLDRFLTQISPQCLKCRTPVVMQVTPAAWQRSNVS